MIASETEKPKYSVIDLAQQKIVRTADVAPEDESANEGGPGRGGFDISPDGKYLYQFRDSVVVLDTADFKVAERIPLAKPELEGMENLNFGALLQSIRTPGERVFSLFQFVRSLCPQSYFPESRLLRSQFAPVRFFAHRSFTNGNVGPRSDAGQEDRLRGGDHRPARHAALPNSGPSTSPVIR